MTRFAPSFMHRPLLLSAVLRGTWLRSGLLAAALLLAASGAAHAADQRTWIVGATVLSPERQDSGRALNVRIEGDRIAEVVDTLPPDAARDAEIVDAKGGVLIPGLIDGHVHLASVPGMSPAQSYLHPGLTKDYHRQLPRSYLRYGFTAVVDLAPPDFGVLDGFVKAPEHPDLYHCGGALPVPNGYPMYLAPSILRSRIFPNFVVDPQYPDNTLFGTSAAEHTPEAAVGRVKERGGVCVKTFFERGFGGYHDLPVPSPELFAGIVKAAHRAGIPVLLHASSLEAQTFGMAGGTDVFVHGMWNWGAHNDEKELPDAVRLVLNRIAGQHTGYEPTFQVLRGLRILLEPDPFAGPDVPRVIPKSLLEWLRTPDGQWFRREFGGGATDEAVRVRLERNLSRGAAVTAYLARKGAFFVFGSDTPSGPTPGNLPGLNGYLELHNLAAAGVSLRQVFEAATINAAKAFGLSGRIGTIEPGKRANLLLLAESPLKTVDAYGKIRTLWIGGRRLDPASLEAKE